MPFLLVHKDVTRLKSNMLDAGGEYAFRIRGENHMWTPDTIAKLQHSTRIGSEKGYQTYKEYANIINDQTKRQMTLRGLFEFKIVLPKILELNAAVEELLPMLQRLIGENIKLVWIPDNPALAASMQRELLAARDRLAGASPSHKIAAILQEYL